MKHLTTLFTALVVFALYVPAAAQDVTTGSMSGIVRDAQGGVLPGATIVAVHTPTGASFEAVTQSDGRFTLLNVRVGGPYELTVTMPGFRTQKVPAVNVSLGETSEVPITLQLETLTETVTVTAEASQIFTPTKTGTTDTVSTGVIENLPSINRSLQDMARINPFFSQTATNSNPSALSVGGRSGRYNNLQIDGAVNNDLFGLADTATPGGQASTEPVSLDVIEELQLVVSPYDVRQGNFSGGGINAITRGGTNTMRGTAYFYSRDQGLVGKGIADRPIATFSDKQAGVSIGGPIRRNREFFFSNFEIGRRDTPAGISIAGSGQQFGRSAEVQQVVEIAQRRYGYALGSTDEFIKVTNNNKFFLRGDANRGKHQLTLRHNFIDGVNDVGTPTLTTFLFPDAYYHFNSKTNSTVGQVNSAFGATVNQFRMTYQRIRDFRQTDTRFPSVIVRFPGNQSVRFGTEQFSGANELDQDIIELHNDYTMVRGKHQFTIGTHNEFFKFRNLFIRDIYGAYDFASIANFEAGLASSYSLSFANGADPRQSARFWVYQLGFYVGDQWRVADRLSLSYGIRLDTPIFPDKPSNNPRVVELYGRRTDETPASQAWSPRIGFNYDLSGAVRRQQVRGGIGIFGGRTPYVWLSNQYSSTGIEFTRVTATNVSFSANPDQQPRSIGGAALNEINLVDPEYSFPKLVRGNLAYDRSLFAGLVGNVEFLFSKVMQDIDYENLNLNPTSTLPDGRARYTRLQPIYSDVILLTNTNEGHSWNIATSIERPYRRGWYAKGSYTYGTSRSVNDGGSSQARSNWVNQQHRGDPNNVPLGISNFDPGHRVTLSGSYQFDLRRAKVTLSAYYNGQNGRPYGYVFSNDVNGDGLGSNNTNDMLYIPRDANDVIVRNGTFDQLMQFLADGNCEGFTPGTIMERNTCRAPWINVFDFKTEIGVPIGRFDTAITFETENLINLFDQENGTIRFALFNGLIPVNGSVDAATGKYIYSLNSIITAPPTPPRYQLDDLRSRWRGQVGFRVRWR